jgi:hypothetical protein
MNSLLTSVEGMDQFVITPEPNVYLVAIRVTPEQAEAFNGNERISVALRVEEGGHEAGVMYVRDITDENQPGEYVAPSDPTDPDDAFTDEQCEVLSATEVQVHDLVAEFLEAVKGDLDEYYEQIAALHGRASFEEFLAQLDAQLEG